MNFTPLGWYDKVSRRKNNTSVFSLNAIDLLALRWMALPVRLVFLPA